MHGYKSPSTLSIGYSVQAHTAHRNSQLAPPTSPWAAWRHLHPHTGGVMPGEGGAGGHCLMGCSLQVVARCAISTTMGGCFGGTVGIIVQLIYSKLCHGQAIW